MGYVKKENMTVTDEGKPMTRVGEYQVVKESKYFSGIYLEGELVTSKPKWSQAVKLATELSEAFEKGREWGRGER